MRGRVAGVVRPEYGDHADEDGDQQGGGLADGADPIRVDDPLHPPRQGPAAGATVVESGLPPQQAEAEEGDQQGDRGGLQDQVERERQIRSRPDTVREDQRTSADVSPTIRRIALNPPVASLAPPPRVTARASRSRSAGPAKGSCAYRKLS